jgi:hypothetical protein
MRVIGYSEDALTYWALCSRLGNMLSALRDDSDPTKCLVIYRPSFGRAGGPTSPQFGDFDAILITQQAVYLIESKWDQCSGLVAPQIQLEQRQVDRHRIFTWLRDRWSQKPALSWSDFFTNTQGDFAAVFSGRRLAPPSSLLAKNLTWLLQTLEQHPRETRNVLLYFHRRGYFPPVAVVDTTGNPLPIEFALVSIDYTPLDNGGLFEMRP